MSRVHRRVAAFATLFSQAIKLNPKFNAVDRCIILYRMRKFDRAFADIERAKRIDRAGHGKPQSVAVKKPRSPWGQD